MTSRLSSDKLTEMTPLLGSLARLIARGTTVDTRQLQMLLTAADLETHPDALQELRRWAHLLQRVYESSDGTLRHAAVEGLMLRGLPEAPALLAVATVAESEKPEVQDGRKARKPPATDKAEQLHAHVGWSFWLQWALASAVGWVIGWSAGEEAIGGAAVGVAQWLVLRRQVRRAGWWVLASAVGWAVGWFFGVILVGAVVGVMQWFVLRRWVRRASWWVLASAVGWAVGWFVGQAAVGAVAGAITGFVLIRLLRSPAPKT